MRTRWARTRPRARPTRRWSPSRSPSTGASSSASSSANSRRVVDGCRSCELNESDLPAWERLYADDHWRVAHGWSSLPGWLIVTSQRHRGHLGELERHEAASLGPILRACSQALCDVLG